MELSNRIKWEVRINNQGNPEKNMVLINDMLLSCSRVEIVAGATDVPELRITIPMVGSAGNEVNVITDTTPFIDQVIVATAKKDA